jgi:hypothetical protein
MCCAVLYFTALSRYDYADLLLNSKFGLVLPGVGEHSYRLLEVLQVVSFHFYCKVSGSKQSNMTLFAHRPGVFQLSSTMTAFYR